MHNDSSRQFHPDNFIPDRTWIWVFGSNEAGRHGKGAAAIAHVNFRAHYGVGQGATGNAYAIPTKDRHLRVLPIDRIAKAVDEFLAYARANPKLRFFVTRVGCGLAGFSDEQMGPLFTQAPLNCSIPTAWAAYMHTQFAEALA